MTVTKMKDQQTSTVEFFALCKRMTAAELQELALAFDLDAQTHAESLRFCQRRITLINMELTTRGALANGDPEESERGEG